MTSMNDAAINAREEAAKELAKLLPTPESLATLASLRADYLQRQQANDSQLSSSVTAQVEQAKSGISLLSSAQATIAQLQKNFDFIEQLCKECDALIENHDQIKELNIVRNNLNKTLKDAEGMLSIHAEAGEARASLNDSRELVKTFERLTALEGKRRFALAAASSRPQEAGKLREFFEDVNRTKEKFEQTLWGIVRDFFKLSKHSPQMLVRALRVVEMQEILDEQVMEEEADAAGVTPEQHLEQQDGSRVSYKDKCYQQIQLGVDDRFRDLLNRLVYEDLKAALEEATAIADDLPDVHKYVAPCFPPHYEIFNLIVQHYMQHFVTMLQSLSDRAKDIPNIDILKLVGWLNTCEEKLLQLGVPKSIAMLPAESGALDPLIDEYVKRMLQDMEEWLKNTFNLDKMNPPQPADAPLYTRLPVDVFQLMAQQVQQVQDNSNSLMLFKTAEAIISLILDFQQQELDWLNEPVENIGLEALCAMVNNNVRCHDLAVDLGNNIVDSLEPKHAEEVDFQEPCAGFLEVAKVAANQTVEFIFVDTIKDLVLKLYSKDWLDGNVTQFLTGTMEDYFSDISKWVEERSFRRFAEACLERTLSSYVDSLLQSRANINDAMLMRLKEDEDALTLLFQDHITEKKLARLMLVLAGIRSLASARDIESFSLCYTQLLQNFPDCQPEVVEKLVNLRGDIAKKDAKDIAKECRDSWEQHLISRGDPKPGFFSKLSALKKK